VRYHRTIARVIVDDAASRQVKAGSAYDRVFAACDECPQSFFLDDGLCVFSRKSQFVAKTHCPAYSGEQRNTIFELESSMNQVQVDQKTYQMPPQDGFTVAHFITVADIERSARFYETVFGGRILSRGDSKGAPGYIQIANMWLIVNVGGGPTPDKPSVTLSVPADPDSVNSFMNIRVADIQACYELWRSRGAEFITEPKDKYGETRCYIRDPDGYIIEVGQSKPGVAYG
jgi:predicted enzyme related to lactoylglutathione lyase